MDCGLQVGLATNFKTARFESNAHTAILHRLEAEINAVLSLERPSSAARALRNGACQIERVDRWLWRNREAVRHSGPAERAGVPRADAAVFTIDGGSRTFPRKSGRLM